MLGQALLITLSGMVVTFAAIALVMVSMFVLTWLARNGDEPTEASTAPHPVESAQVEEEPIADLVLPAKTPLEQVAAAAVAVATGRELTRQRHSAHVWLSPQPRSLVSPWQLTARDRQMNRKRK